MSGHHKGKSVPREERWSVFWTGFWTFLAIGILCAALSEWMPVAEGAKRILTRIWGPSLTATYPTTGRDQITVMLIDDQDLRDYDEVWPVSLGFHQRRLLDLLTYHPKAVFFDMVFLDDRKDPGLEEFIDAACRARRAGVPVFIGAFGDPAMKVSRTQQAMLARRVDVAGQPLPCIEAAYLNLKIDGFDQSVWEYDLDVPATPVAHGEGDHAGHPIPGAHGATLAYPSPAARLYQVDHPLAAHVVEEPMALVWGTASSPANLEWINSDVRPGGPGAACSASWKWYRMLPVGKASAPICPYQRMLPARTLKRTNGLDAGELAEAIGNKYVVIGTQLQSNGDVILSPYHGRIAGAFLHAMALDNLLSFQGAPKASGEFGHPLNSKASGFTLFALVLISALSAYKALFDIDALVSKWFTRRKPSDSAAGRQVRLAWQATARWVVARLLLAAVFLLAITILIGISYYWLDLGPLVWIEYALFPIAAEFLHLGKEVGERLEQCRNYVRGVRLAIKPVSPLQ